MLKPVDIRVSMLVIPNQYLVCHRRTVGTQTPRNSSALTDRPNYYGQSADERATHGRRMTAR
ncbi:hypothetical protein C8039_10940 [Halogeometricum sp. wsp3]|nr:hypothetical protein C8039_10940 [Halogeometricum sp. wsp3]